MKNLIFTIIILCSLTVIAQTNTEKLNYQKNTITKQIEILKDSLVLIDKKIAENEKFQFNLELTKKGIPPVNVEVSEVFTNFYKVDDSSLGVICQIPKGTKLKIVDVGGFIGNYLKTEYQNKSGYVLSIDIIKTPELLKFVQVSQAIKDEAISKIRKQKEDIENKLSEEIRKNRIKDLTIRFGSKIASRILTRTYWIGMNKEMAVEAMGNPIKVNRTVIPGKVTEQWVYPYDTYLYFDNGILTTYQN